MNGKIVVKLRGGLGNQLFQYAFAKNVQKRISNKELVLDTSYFRKKHIRNLELNQMCIDPAVSWSAEYNRTFDLLYDGYRLLDRIHHGVEMKKPLVLGRDAYLFCDKTMDIDVAQLSCRNIYLAGYFQQEKVVREVKDELLEEIKPKKLSDNARSFEQMIRSSDSIGISIRAGEDYHRFGWPVCSKEYYIEGLKRLYTGGEKIFVFADVIDKVVREDWFKGNKVQYIKGCSSCEGLYLLSLCKDYIIANSTFSWWGAYMGRKENKRLICPKNFYPNVIMKGSALEINHSQYLDNFTGEVIDNA